MLVLGWITWDHGCCLSLSIKPCLSPSSGLRDPGTRPPLVLSALLFSQCHSQSPPKASMGSPKLDLSSPRTGGRKGRARCWRPHHQTRLPRLWEGYENRSGGQGWVSALGVSVDCIPCGWKMAPRALWGMCLCVSALVCVGACVWVHLRGHMCVSQGAPHWKPEGWQLPPAPHLSP